MANRYNGKIIVIDTTDTQIGGPTPTGGPIGSLSVKAIKWVTTQNSGKDIAVDDDLGIKLGSVSGDYIIEARSESGSGATADTALSAVAYSVEFGTPWIVPGLYIEDLDGGELQIFLD